MLSFKKVYFAYSEGRRKHNALVDFSFFSKKGEFVCVIGPNGSGKSTLLKLAKGILTADSGEIKIDGFSINSDEGKKKAFGEVSIILENPETQVVAPVVEEDILFGLENFGFSVEDAARRIKEITELLDIKELINESVDRLSSGELQRVVLAGALATEPQIILSDESTSWLDPAARLEIIDTFKNLTERGKTVVHVTHHPDEVVKADRVYVLLEGSAARIGPPDSIFSSSYSLLKNGIKVPMTALISEALREKQMSGGAGHPLLTAEELVNEYLRT